MTDAQTEKLLALLEELVEYTRSSHNYLLPRKLEKVFEDFKDALENSVKS